METYDFSDNFIKKYDRLVFTVFLLLQSCLLIFNLIFVSVHTFNIVIKDYFA